MTRARFFLAMLPVFAGLAGLAAPVQKDADKDVAAPELKPVFEALAKAVENGKWPAELDEKRLRDTARAIFDRATGAAEQAERKFPVEFDKLSKAGVVKKLSEGRLDGDFVIAGDVQIAAARNSVVLCSGNVQITRAANSVVIGRHVRCNTADNCLVVAGDTIRAVGADRRERHEGSVLVADRLIRVNGARGAICHVIHPAFGQQFPGDKVVDPVAPPIRLTSANQVVVLNSVDHWKATTNKNSRTAIPKAPIAK